MIFCKVKSKQTTNLMLLYSSNTLNKSKSFIILVIFLMLSVIGKVYGQFGILKGSVTDLKGNPLSYASIYHPVSAKGAVTNFDGNFQINMPVGEQVIEFSFLGYQRKKVGINIGSDTTVVLVKLKREAYLLREVVVGLDEDPAYEMIRQAIKKRKKNLIRTGTFEASVYSKGIYKLEQISDSIFGKSLFDSTETKEDALGIIYLSEAESKFSLQYPDKLKEEIISSRVSGESKGFSFNFISFVNINLYHDLVQIPFDRSGRSFVSPIAGNALMYYRYKLVGSFLDGDFLVHKIELKPKRKIDRVFHGYIYLVEGLWCIHGSEVIITEDAEIDFIDSIRINQEFVPMNDSILALQTQNFNFDFSFNLFGIEAAFNGHYLTIFNEYEWNPDFPESYFGNEIYKIDKASNKKDSAYWEANRPVPLSTEEEENYIEFDSLELVHSSEAYLDSLDRIANKPEWHNILLNGYKHRDRFKERDITIGTPLQKIAFNTVQGFNVKLPLKVKQDFEEKRYYSQRLDMAYGFSNNSFDLNSESEYFYNRDHFAKIRVLFGRIHAQFNQSNPAQPFVNSLYSLLGEQNLMKLYRKTYLSVNHQSELFNGMYFSANLEFADREPLDNNSAYRFRENPNREYTPNAAWTDIPLASFNRHQALIITLASTYTIGQKYASIPYKTRLGSKYPRIGISYSKAISGVLGSDADFDYIKLHSSYAKSMGLLGRSRVELVYGTFLSKKRLDFTDYFHFSGNRTIVFNSPNNTFHLLDYYSRSTNKEFVELHYQHHFNGFIINKIPWVRKSKLMMVAGSHYLFQELDNQYLELNIGVKNIFKITRLDFIFAFDRHKKLRPGLTFSFSM